MEREGVTGVAGVFGRMAMSGVPSWFVRKCRQLQVRILATGATRDYGVVAAIAGIPLLLSPIIGAAVSTAAPNGVRFLGYYARWNWMSMVLLLPGALWSIRRFMIELFPQDGGRLPPVAELLAEVDRASGARDLFSYTFRASNIIIALVLMLILTAIDMWSIVHCYLSMGLGGVGATCPMEEPDWTIVFVTGTVSVWWNAVLVAIAYLSQFMVGGLALLLGIWLLRHNRFFLAMIYQRRRDRESARGKVVIDIDDTDDCFGFRPAYRAFNTQVLAVIAAGLAVLCSRFSNVDEGVSARFYGAVGNLLVSLVKRDKLADLVDAAAVADWFPDVGQCLLALVWLVLLCVVSLPALVKVLPFVGTVRVGPRITDYLREFFPPGRIDNLDLPAPSKAHVDDVKDRFKRQAFWPTGDTNAQVFFTFAFYVFLVILLPVRPILGKLGLFLSLQIVLLGVAGAMTVGALMLLRLPLRAFNEGLVGDD
jgi:hypothetical protein